MMNINIDGAGTFDGGEYNTITISGSARSHGALTCDSISSDGAFSCAGGLNAKTTDVDGSMSINGDMNTQQFYLDGSTVVHGNLKSDTVEVDGSLTVHGQIETAKLELDGALKCTYLRTERFDCDGAATIDEGIYSGAVNIDGVLKTDGNLEAETLYVDGCLTAQKQISADKIEISGIVRADEIVGDFIYIDCEDESRTVRTVKKLFRNLLNRKESERNSSANLIEATTVELYNITAGVVSGQNVTIGENCRIDRLDCTGIYTIDPTATVRLLNGEPYNP